jgi:hypothetical protein
MAITLAAIPEGNIWTQALILAVVGIGITVGVYAATLRSLRCQFWSIRCAHSGFTSRNGQFSACSEPKGPARFLEGRQPGTGTPNEMVNFGC